MPTQVPPPHAGRGVPGTGSHSSASVSPSPEGTGGSPLERDTSGTPWGGGAGCDPPRGAPLGGGAGWGEGQFRGAGRGIYLSQEPSPLVEHPAALVPDVPAGGGLGPCAPRDHPARSAPHQGHPEGHPHPDTVTPSAPAWGCPWGPRVLSAPPAPSTHRSGPRSLPRKTSVTKPGPPRCSPRPGMRSTGRSRTGIRPCRGVPVPLPPPQLGLGGGPEGVLRLFCSICAPLRRHRPPSPTAGAPGPQGLTGGRGGLGAPLGLDINNAAGRDGRRTGRVGGGSLARPPRSCAGDARSSRVPPARRRRDAEPGLSLRDAADEGRHGRGGLRGRLGPPRGTPRCWVSS